jgi:hypothetical protein
MSAAQAWTWRIAAIAFASLLAASAPAFAGSGAAIIQPGSPQAAQAISRLKHAAYIDRQNAKAHSGAADSDLGLYYAQKAKEARALERKLKSGQAVSQTEVDRTLSTKQASHYRAD